MSNAPLKVIGEDCLRYIDKPIGFCSKGVVDYGGGNLRNGRLQSHVYADTEYNQLYMYWTDQVEIVKFLHDTNKRIVAVIDRTFSDGGIKAHILGNESLNTRDSRNCRNYFHELYLFGYREYEPTQPSPLGPWKPKGNYQYYPSCPSGATIGENSSECYLQVFNQTQTFIDTLDYAIDFDTGSGEYYNPYCISSGQITNDKNNTLIFGKELDIQPRINPEFQGDPLRYACGNLYGLCTTRNDQLGHGLMERDFADYVAFSSFAFNGGEPLLSGNNVSIPYNIILTYNDIYAQAYLENGTLPPDAFLFPLDWESLPSYDPDDEKDDDEDNDQDDDNKPGFDGEPDLPEVPRFPPSSLSNNNYYWLDVGQLENFISWFWNDVGELSDFDDIINKVKGLYNDLGSTILMLRYMPVDIVNLGGLGEPSPIILGMIEKAGNVPTISKNPPPIVDIGHVKVPKEYKSFASHSPYAQCTLYLPFFGYLELDMDMFTGHDIYVKAIYDYLTGTIQYLIYYENKYLINSMVCKMAVDIPITLQSKNDRDSAIFQNVSNAMAGLTSGTMSLASGNPIGLLGLGQAVNAGQQSAPLSVRGIVGEQGAFYAPNKCKLITTFPVQQKPSNFNEICGKQTNKTYTLSKISGYTECYNPRIIFDKTVPLHEEEEEIYNYLEKGVIL